MTSNLRVCGYFLSDIVLRNLCGKVYYTSRGRLIISTSIVSPSFTVWCADIEGAHAAVECRVMDSLRTNDS